MFSHSQQPRSRFFFASVVFLLVLILSGCEQDIDTSGTPGPDSQAQDGTDNQPPNTDNGTSGTASPDAQTPDGTDNQPPIAKITAPKGLTSGQTATLHGNGSSDPDGDDLSYTWTQTKGPIIELSNSSSSSLTFVAPSVAQPTQFSFELTVHDGELSNSATVSVQISPMADNTLPSIVSRSPRPDQSGVSTTAEIRVGFDKPLLESSVDSQSLVLSESGSPVSGVVSYDSANQTITYKPASALSSGATYTVTLADTLEDLSANAFAGESWSFSTRQTDTDTDFDAGSDADADSSICLPPTDTSNGHYQMEDLDRGVVAVRTGNGNFVSWRMMGYEYDRGNPANIVYNLYRDDSLIAIVTESTNYQDSTGGAGATYAVSASIGGSECARSEPVGVWSDNYLRIPLDSPGDYEANDASPGDLDGDGEYEIVLKWSPKNAKDNSQSGVTGNTILEALKLDGTRMWRVDLGINIRSGAHYTQHSVYDFDGDGKSEVACKTAPGTRDGTGEYLHTGPAANDDDSADYRNSKGYILSGPEYYTVFDGETGAELATVAYPVPRGKVGDWGDTYGNRVDRFNGGVSFVSDTGSGLSASGRPSIITQRGYYTRLTIGALNWRDGTLGKLWTYDSDVDSGAHGQGNHSLMTADADNDGAMELIPGSSTINSDGTFRCSTGMGHGDALHVGELIVGNGIHVFMPHEEKGGHDCHRADTCEFAFNVTGGKDNGRGVAEYVSMSNTSSATCSSGTGSVNCINGKGSPSSAGNNFLIYWDGDDVRELLNGNKITKAGGGTLLTASGCASNNGTKSTPTLTADLLGDWREELVLRESDNSALRVYTTTTPTTRRIYTLMHDPVYRMQVTFEQSSYNQPPHVGFHIGAGMVDPPEPDIYVR